MLTVASVIRKTPVSTLRSYFDTRRIDMSHSVNWQGHRTPMAKRLIKAVENLKKDSYGIVATEFERIQEMTDEAGQAAIAGIIQNPSDLLSLENGHDRAMWLFLSNENGFRRAEEVRFSEHYRQGQKWAGFVGPKGLNVCYDDEYRREFESRICDMFKSGNAHLEVYERLRFGLDESPSQVTQTVVYREGLPGSSLAFDKNGELERKPSQQVLEAVITYDAKSGVIEVVGLDSKSRPRLARLFAEVLLRQPILGVFLPLRQYDLCSLLVPRKFPTDPEDGISHVQVMSLALRHKDIPYADIVYELKQRCELTPYEYSDRVMLKQGPLNQPDFVIIRATLSVHFRPDRHNKRGKTISLSLTLPNGCDLKGKTKKERLICEKYLPQWNLVKEA